MTAARVTKHACAECGGQLAQPPTGRPRRTCSDACRQVLSRRRRRQGSLPTPASQARLQLTFEERQALRAEVDRLSRVRLVEKARRQAALDAQLAEEAWA